MTFLTILNVDFSDLLFFFLNLEMLGRNGSNTKGYFLWSLLDGFEPIGGYTTSFGLYYVDLDDKQLKRYPKLSAHWYSNFLKGRTIKPDEINEVVNEIFVSSTSKASDQ